MEQSELARQEPDEKTMTFVSNPSQIALTPRLCPIADTAHDESRTSPLRRRNLASI